VRVSLDVADTVDAQLAADGVALKLFVSAHRRDLLSRAHDADAPVEVRVGGQERHVEALDATLLLHPAHHAHRLVERLDGTLLHATYRIAPTDEQHSIGHTDSFQMSARPGSRACGSRLSHRNLRPWEKVGVLVWALRAGSGGRGALSCPARVASG